MHHLTKRWPDFSVWVLDAAELSGQNKCTVELRCTLPTPATAQLEPARHQGHWRETSVRILRRVGVRILRRASVRILRRVSVRILRRVSVRILSRVSIRILRRVSVRIVRILSRVSIRNLRRGSVRILTAVINSVTGRGDQTGYVAHKLLLSGIMPPALSMSPCEYCESC